MLKRFNSVPQQNLKIDLNFSGCPNFNSILWKMKKHPQIFTQGTSARNFMPDPTIFEVSRLPKGIWDTQTDRHSQILAQMKLRTILSLHNNLPGWLQLYCRSTFQELIAICWNHLSIHDQLFQHRSRPMEHLWGYK